MTAERDLVGYGADPNACVALARERGSVILAGVLLKLGGYGFLRFALPLFPDAVRDAVPLFFALALVGIVYGSLVAMVQRDVKKLVAYSSVSHMGYVLLGMAVVSALQFKPPAGAGIAFLLGAYRDWLYGGPLGVETFMFTVAGWSVGSVGKSIYREATLTRAVMLFLAVLGRHAGITRIC